jgi:hypothetical protein
MFVSVAFLKLAFKHVLHSFARQCLLYATGVEARVGQIASVE